MGLINKSIKIKTNKELEFIRITEKISEIVRTSNIKNGYIMLFCRHTTFGLKINEDEPLLMKDFLWLMQRIAPENINYEHDNLELRENCPADEPKNAAGHLRTLLLENSQTIPIVNGKMHLGTYQQIFAIETSGPREREIYIQISGE